MNARPKTGTPTTEMRADDEVSRTLSKRVTHSASGLTFDGATTYEEWSQCLPFYFGLRDKSKFWLGDAIIFGANKFSDRYSQAIEMTGRTRHDLINIVAVCERIAPSRRRDSLSFEHHAAVAYDIPYQEADRILKEAESKGWGREDVRDAVCRIQGKPTKAERDAIKAKKQPPTIDVAARVSALAATPKVNAATTMQLPAPAPAPPDRATDPLAIAEARLHHLNEALSGIDPKTFSHLQREKWLKLLTQIDAFIDALIAKEGAS